MKNHRYWSAIVFALFLALTGPAAWATAEPGLAAEDYVLISPKKLPARIDSSQEIYINVGENMVTVRAVFAYQIRNSGLVSLSVPVPDKYRVTGVEGDKIKEAKVESGVLLVRLKEAVKDEYRLTVTLDKPRESAGGTEEIPELKTEEAVSEAGWISVAVAPGMEVEVKDLTALRSVDPSELPAAMAGGSPLLAFRFDRHPVAGTLALTRRDQLTSLNASIDTINLVTVITAEGRSITRVIYEVRNNMKQNLEIALPPGAKVWSAFVNEQPAKVATDGKDSVFIPLLGARGSRAGTVTVELSYYLTLAKLEKNGKIKTIFPKADLPASEMMASIYLPFKYQYKDFKGTMEKLEDGLDEIAAHGRMTSWLQAPASGARDDKRGGAKLNLNSNFANERQSVMEVEIAEQVRSGKMQKMMADIDADNAGGLKSPGYIDGSGPAAGTPKSGLLPVKFSVPLRGSVYRFTKLVVVDEAPEMSFSYKKLRAPIPWNQVFWAGKIAAVALVTLLLIIIIYRLWKRPRGTGQAPAPAAPPEMDAETVAVPGV